MRIRTIDNFLDVDQKLFALSVIEDRAIPSVIDGFKPVQRKIIYMANKIWKTGSEKPMKVFQLGGQVSSLALYEHGDASMNSSIISMNQTFKNNLPLLDRNTCNYILDFFEFFGDNLDILLYWLESIFYHNHLMM